MPARTDHPSTHQNAPKRTTFLGCTLGITAMLTSLPACSSAPSHPPSNQSRPIIAMLNAQPITDDDLWSMLGEAAGGQVLNEYILTQLLDERAQQEQWAITESDTQLELDALAWTIDQAATPENTARLITTIRARRGLGPARFQALLRRNAILRRLVQSDPAVMTEIRSRVDQAIAELQSPPSDEQRAGIIRRATLVAQQSAMESLARSMVDNAEIMVMDRSINWSRRAGQ